MEKLGSGRMRGRWGRRIALSLSTILMSGFAAPALAQDTTPTRPANDSHMVDVNAGVATATTQEIRIGDLAFVPNWTGALRFDTSMGYIVGTGTGPDRTVFVHGVSKRFVNTGGTTYAPADGDGSTLVKSATGNEVYTYTTPDGSIFYFAGMIATGDRGFLPNRKSHLQTITRPDGRVYTYHYNLAYQQSCRPTGCFNITYIRVQSITTSDGFMAKFGYAADTLAGDFLKLTSAKTINLSVDYCDPDANSCGALTTSWPSQTVSESTSGSTVTTTITDQDSNTTTVTSSPGAGVTSVDQPGSTGGDVTVTYDGSNRVDTITQDGATYDYSYADSGTNRTTVVTAPDSSTVTYVTDIPSSRITSVTNEQSQITSYQYDGSGRKTRETQPEGNYTQWTYDARGNVTEVRHVAKSGSGLADVVETASFDTTCVYVAKCNKPNYTIDARGNRTDYSYDNSHGGLTRVQLPSPDGVQPRPEINYGYTALYAQQRNSSGTLVTVSTPQYKVTQITACATAATCAGSANESKITLAYNTPHLLLTSKTAAAGDGSLRAPETYSYDSEGRVATVDGPLSGTNDTTYYFYAIGGKLLGVIHPDPDGSGPRLRTAERFLYYWRLSQVKTAMVGSVSGTTVGDLLAMTPDQKVEYSYDANGNRTLEKLSGGSTVYQITQYSYDGKDRLECAAIRMNPAVFGSLPTSACTAGIASSFGPDRITKNSYDSANRITKVQIAYGTAEQADEVTSSYTNNGKLASVTDGEGNKTSYEYDGHDRLSVTRYPVTTAGSGTSSTSDYEQFGYDAASNVTSRRLRDGQTITYGYDYLNRGTSKTTPGSVNGDWDVTYGYDLLGRVTSAVGDGWAVTAFGYDALGRLTTEQNYNSTTYHAYDLAGRQTRLTWGDGFYVDYDYNVADEVTAIRENGATSGVGVLASYGYDDLGRRTSVTRGNGTTTSYSYDGVSRLASLTQDLAGSAYDVTNGFSYNPAGQITSMTRSNDAYAWNGAANAAKAYTVNGLNQATAAAGVSIGHDGRGNMSSIGTASYGYTTENRLVSAPGATMLYEPGGGQLLQFYNTGTGQDTRFAWSGGQMIAEISASTWAITRRYVPGPGVDEPIVWYEGSGTSDRRWPHADERGSVVAVTDGSGNAIGINRYDEYGIPGSGNIGRFQYTGQAWLPEIGMYYYKARIYSPTLGRFLQTDPIGYVDGLNLYGYVSGDPINLIDPEGMQSCSTWYQNSYRYYDKNNNKQHDAGEPIVPGSATSVPYQVCTGDSAKTQAGGGFGEGGGSTGGGGASGSWDDEVADSPEIVVTGRRVVRSALVSTLPRPKYKIVFGYPPERNAAHHINRHLTNLSSRQRMQLQNAIRSNILRNFKGHAQSYISVEVLNGRHYEFRAFLLPNGIVNVGTIFEVDD